MEEKNSFKKSMKEVIKLNLLKNTPIAKKQNKNWTEITDNTWIPDIGDKIEGKLIEIKEYDGEYRSQIYILKTEENKKIKVWGSTYLDNLMDEIKIDDYIRITYNGNKKTSNGYDMKLFKLERRINNE